MLPTVCPVVCVFCVRAFAVWEFESLSLGLRFWLWGSGVLYVDPCASGPDRLSHVGALDRLSLHCQ